MDEFVQNVKKQWNEFYRLTAQLPDWGTKNEQPEQFWLNAIVNSKSDQAVAMGPQLMKVVDCILATPVSTAENERIGSYLKYALQPPVSRMSDEVLNAILTIKYNAPDFDDSDSNKYALGLAKRARMEVPTIIDGKVFI